MFKYDLTYRYQNNKGTKKRTFYNTDIMNEWIKRYNIIIVEINKIAL